MLYDPTGGVDYGGYRGFGKKIAHHKYHFGHDYNVHTGNNVYAIYDGPVLFARVDVDGFGGYEPLTKGGVVWQQIFLDGEYYCIHYGHVLPLVQENQLINGCQVIGTVHNYKHRGLELPHLHFCVYRGFEIPSHNWGYGNKEELNNFIKPYDFFYKGVR